MMRSAQLLLLAILLAAPIARADNWPRFRGPNGQGTSTEKNLPTTWSATENIAWKTEIPGEGWSSPIVWGDQIFLTATTERGVSCHVICISKASGKILWNTKVFDQETTRKEGKNSYATPTPVTDGEAVYAFFASGSAVALGMDGRILWTKRDHRFYSRHGLGSSPILYRELLIMPFDWSVVPGAGVEERTGWQIPWDKSYVLALDKNSAEQKWQTARGMSRIAHVTPIIADVGGKEVIISPGGDVVQAFDPVNGALLWTVRSGGEGVVPSPILAGDNLLITASGFPTNVRGGSAIRAIRLDPNAKGDITDTHIAWEQKKNVPNLPSLVYSEPHLFGIKENGMAMCLDPKDGSIVWDQRVQGNFSASPVVADGKIYLLAESGETVVIEAGPTFKEISRNRLGDAESPTQASMAISDGKLFIRTAKHLWCVGK